MMCFMKYSKVLLNILEVFLGLKIDGIAKINKNNEI